MLIGLCLWLAPKSVLGQGFTANQYFPLVLKEYPTSTPTPAPGYVLITEVLYDPLGAEPDGEWIELFNPGSSDVDLSLYKLGDEETMGEMEGMLIFPPGAILRAGEVIIIANRAAAFFQVYGELPNYEMHESDSSIPDLLKYSAWSGGNIEMVNGGDEVLLLNERNAIADGLSWGNSREILDPPVPGVAEPGFSLERIPANRDTDTAADWIDQGNPSPGEVDISTPTPTPTQTRESTPVPPELITLLISEVVYNPLVEPGGEWIEVFNYGDAVLSLANIRIGDEETLGDGEGMLVFPASGTIEVDDAVIIGKQATAFFDTYGFNPDFEMDNSDPAVLDMLKDLSWGSGSVSLMNTGDEVLMLDQNGQLLDGISWGNSDAILKPPIDGVAPGHSLERYPPGEDTNAASDWRDQPLPQPGSVDDTALTPTPTATNTPSPTLPPVLVINEIHADPDLSLGDANGDGIIDSFQDEFVEVINITGSPVDLSGWTLLDSTGVRHTFPPESLVLDQCPVLVFGGGQPEGDFGGSLVQTSSSGMLGLNNGGDQISLADLQASIVLSYTYGAEGGDDQSLTRYPDITGEEPLIKHSTAPGSNGALFSPGRRSDSAVFTGCSVDQEIWVRRLIPAPAGLP